MWSNGLPTSLPVVVRLFPTVSVVVTRVSLLLLTAHTSRRDRRSRGSHGRGIVVAVITIAGQARTQLTLSEDLANCSKVTGVVSQRAQRRAPMSMSVGVYHPQRQRLTWLVSFSCCRCGLVARGNLQWAGRKLLLSRELESVGYREKRYKSLRLVIGPSVESFLRIGPERSDLDLIIPFLTCHFKLNTSNTSLNTSTSSLPSRKWPGAFQNPERYHCLTYV